MDRNCRVQEVPASALPDGGDAALDLHWLSPAQMAERFADMPEALAQAGEIAAHVPSGLARWPTDLAGAGSARGPVGGRGVAGGGGGWAGGAIRPGPGPGHPRPAGCGVGGDWAARLCAPLFAGGGCGALCPRAGHSGEHEGQRGQQFGGLCLGHHDRGPDFARPALSALFEPGPDRAAGHRSGFLFPAAGRSAGLYSGQAWGRPGGVGGDHQHHAGQVRRGGDGQGLWAGPGGHRRLAEAAAPGLAPGPPAAGAQVRGRDAGRDRRSRCTGG